jgi:hypothetical protein
MEMKATHVTVEGCHSYSNPSIRQRIAVTRQKDAHKFRQATQLWRLEVVQFAIEAESYSARRFLFLLQGIIMQRTAIRMQLVTKDMLMQSDIGNKTDGVWRT